jgi:iron complex outermembrane receptor protein
MRVLKSNRILLEMSKITAVFAAAGMLVGTALAASQSPGSASLRGRVTIRDNGAPVINASVLIIQLDRSTMTDSDGKYEFLDLPPGTYDVISHMHALADEVRTVKIAPGQSVVVNFELSFEPLRQDVTVTATGHTQTAFESFQAITSLNSLELVGKNAFALGEVVKDQPGVSVRSFGPGSARPVLRGFDGDRVLILADGLPTGTLSAQSGEHAEPLDAAFLNRLEIVKGPATLLYGSNAIGGVVNAVTEHHLIHEHPHEGLRGQIIAEGGSNNSRVSGGAGGEYGHKDWIVWGHGSHQVAGDYHSPEGRVENSGTRMTSGNLGFGWFGNRAFFSLGYYLNKGRLGIPFADVFHHHEEKEKEGQHEGEAELPCQVDEVFTWQNVRLSAGLINTGKFMEKIKVAANFSRWRHEELEGGIPATTFDNRLLNLRVTFDQHKTRLSDGSFGFHFWNRDCRSQGEESLSPPVIANGFAAFVLQELRFPRIQLQFGGRMERIGYDPAGLPRRSYTGFSAAAGIRFSLWKDGNFVANYTHSYRVPAVEELYNYGPHVGNLAFEIGDPNLKREASDGLDLSVRHQGSVIQAQANFFYYHIRDFVYLAFTGEIREGLREASYSQADARFIGGEGEIDLAVHSHIWLHLGLDMVNAKLIQSNLPLPRIPPLRGRIGIEARYKGFVLNPEIVMASDQNRIYPTETRTPGFTVVNLDASYILAKSHLAHVFAMSIFNVGNRLYRNHLSFIKDFAPEMGRGIRFSYSLRFF